MLHQKKPKPILKIKKLKKKELCTAPTYSTTNILPQ